VHIPAVGESPALPYDEGEHLVTNLKWEPRTSAGRLPDDQTRQHYLSAVMLLALANLVADPRVHAREVELRWSYPAVFERQNRLDGQARAMEAVAAQLSRWTGLSVHANRGADEATVASAGSTSQFATDVLYVDVGGGTVDVLFGRYAAGERAHHGSRQPIYALSSFRFAGDDYVDMLVEGRFLDPNLSRERFLRAVRTAPRLDQDFGRRTLNGSRLDPARSRTVLFFGYLIEHMARLIAARLLDGSRLDTADGRYVVSVSLLGNGWAFVGLTTADPQAWLQQKLSARVEQLLRAEADPPAGSARALGLPWAVECNRGGEVLPKQVVAQGLLRSMGDERRQDLRSRNILGLSTFVGQRYPWYLPIVDTWSDTDLRLSRHAPLAEGHRAWWRPEDDPGFAANLPGLHEVDPELRQSYAHLCRRVLPGPGDDWFVRNALEVVLEDVVRPQLSRISKVSVP
jgi:hypothetical protein